MGSMMQFELNIPLDLLAYFSKLKNEQCFEMQAAVNGEALNSCLKLTRAEKHMELILTGHVADLVELSARKWKCIISKVSANDDPVDGSPDSSLIILPQTNFTKLASLTMMDPDPDDIKSEDEETQESQSSQLDRASQIRFLSTLPIDSPIKGVVTCSICQKLFKTLKGIQNHVLRIHKQKWMSYLQDIDDDNLAELISHQGTRAVVTPLRQSEKIKCGECRSIFGSNCLLLKHYEEAHITGADKRSGMRSRIVLRRLNKGNEKEDSMEDDSDIQPFETDSDPEFEATGIVSAIESLDKEMQAQKQRSSTPIEEVTQDISQKVNGAEDENDDASTVVSEASTVVSSKPKMRYPCPLCNHTFCSTKYTVFHIKKHHLGLAEAEMKHAIEEARKSGTKGEVYIVCGFCSGELKGRNLLTHLKKWHVHEATYNQMMNQTFEKLKNIGLYHIGDDTEFCQEEDNSVIVSGEKESDVVADAVPLPEVVEKVVSPPKEVAPTTHQDEEEGDLVICEDEEESEDEVVREVGLCRYRPITQTYTCSFCDFTSSSKSDFRIHVLQKHMDQATYKEVERQVEDQMLYISTPDETIMIQCEFCQRQRPGRGMLHHLQVWHKEETAYEEFLKRICEKLKKMGLYMKTDEQNHSKEIQLKRKGYFHYKLNTREEFLLYVKHRTGESVETEEGNEDADVSASKTIKRTLQTRKKSVTRKGDYECSLCAFKTLYHSSMGRHLRTSHSGLSTIARRKMLDDMHNPGSSKATRIACEICGKERWGKSIFRHLEIWHSKVDRFEAVLAQTKAAMMERNKRRKWQALIQDGICCHCQQKFGTPEEVRKHKKSCSKNKLQKTRKLLCFYCEYKAKSKDDLVAHKMAQHQKKSSTHVCEICGAVYKSPGGLLTHRFVKHNISGKNANEWKCDKCEKKFKLKAVFERHLLTHSNVLLAKCDICSKSYKTKGDLNVHYKRIHLNIYPYHCDKCGHGVQRKEWLERHNCSNIRARQIRNNLPKTQQTLAAQTYNMNPTIPTTVASNPILQNINYTKPITQPSPTTVTQILQNINYTKPITQPSPTTVTQILQNINYTKPITQPSPTTVTQILQNINCTKSITQPSPTTVTQILQNINCTKPITQPSPTTVTQIQATISQPVFQMSAPSITNPQMSIPQRTVYETLMPVQHISPPTLPINIPVMVSVPNATTDPSYFQLTPLVSALAMPQVGSAAFQDLSFSPAQPVPLLSTFPQDGESHEQTPTVVAPNFNGTLQAKDVAWANVSWPLSTD